MAKLRWLKWGISFSIVIFIAIYLLIYNKIAFSQETAVLMLGNWDVSFLKVFLSDIKNVILYSLVLGFLLGVIPAIGSGKNKNKEDTNQIVQNQVVRN